MKRKNLYTGIARILFAISVLVLFLLLLPDKGQIPVKNASKQDWDRHSFWHYPWGRSVTHKGIDIFAEQGTEVLSPTYGLIINVKTTINGGNTIVLLGPKLRTHYFAHLESTYVSKFTFVQKGERIGSVGNTGNASSKNPHLHYSIFTLIPYIWNYDEFSHQGFMKIFYINPILYFE